MNRETELYINKYWDVLTKVNKSSNIKGIMEDMLADIKMILSNFKFINIYNGYQYIADIWTNSLTEDLEIISSSNLYQAARTREANMITKGSGKTKREEQDGWVSSLIPSNLIVDQLFNLEESNIQKLKQELSEIEVKLEELVEAAKVEDSDENEVLYECLCKNKDGEVGNSFTAKAVRDAIKEYDKGTYEANLLTSIDKLMKNRTKTNRNIGIKEKELKELVGERILILTDKEIDSLIYEKWFGSLNEKMINLIENPLKEELERLEIIDKRYKYTLNDLDEEYNKLESEFNSLLSELVRTLCVSIVVV